MPRVSIAPKDASEGGSFLQQGDVRVVAGKYLIHQYQPNKTTGDQAAPFPCLALTMQLMVDGKKEGEPQLMTYGAGKLGKFAPSEDGDEPVGDDVGDEGPFLVALADKGPDKRCGLMVFTGELVKCGFKESVLEQGDARSFVGLEGHVMTKKFPGIDGGKEYGVVVFDKITSRPYEKKTSGKTKAAAAKDDDAEEAEGGEESGADNAAKTKLTTIMTKLVVKLDEDGKDRKGVKKDVLARVIAEPAKLQKAVMEMFDDDDELKAIGKEAGFKISRAGLIVPVEGD